MESIPKEMVFWVPGLHRQKKVAWFFFGSKSLRIFRGPSKRRICPNLKIQEVKRGKDSSWHLKTINSKWLWKPDSARLPTGDWSKAQSARCCTNWALSSVPTLKAWHSGGCVCVPRVEGRDRWELPKAPWSWVSSSGSQWETLSQRIRWAAFWRTPEADL